MPTDEASPWPQWVSLSPVLLLKDYPRLLAVQMTAKEKDNGQTFNHQLGAHPDARAGSAGRLYCHQTITSRGGGVT